MSRSSRPKPAPPPPLKSYPKPPAGGYKCERAPDGRGLLIRIPGVTTSACIIGCNNAATIGPCITSILPHVDEVIFTDTGSTDGTPDIARSLGACVFPFSWCDDFSAARNACNRHARGKWIFSLDTDEVFPEQCARILHQCA